MHPILDVTPAPSVDARAERPRAGDQDTGQAVRDFRALFDAEFSYVWHALRRLGVHGSDLEDLSHEVFLRVYRQRADYDAARPLRPWLFGFAFRVASDHRKLARHRYEVRGNELDPADPGPGADEQLMARDKRALVDAAIDALDIDHRTPFILHELEGHKVTEIAHALGIPIFTVYSRLRVAREKFGAAVRRLKMQRGEA